MSATRTVDDLQILLAQSDINEKDANTFAMQCKDRPKIISAVCNLIKAFYKNPDLAKQLGVGDSLEELLGYIPGVIDSIDEEQKKHPEKTYESKGEDLVTNVIEELTAILNPDTLTSATHAQGSPQKESEQMTLPLRNALDKVKEATTNTQAKPNVAVDQGDRTNMMVMGFMGCVGILGGIACLAIGIATFPVSGVAGLLMGIYGAVLLFGLAGGSFSIAYQSRPKINTQAAEVPTKKTGAGEPSGIEMVNMFKEIATKNQPGSGTGSTNKAEAAPTPTKK